jgi:hypothetical protein
VTGADIEGSQAEILSLQGKTHKQEVLHGQHLGAAWHFGDYSSIRMHTKCMQQAERGDKAHKHAKRRQPTNARITHH